VQGHRASHLLLLQAEKELSCHVSTRWVKVSCWYKIAEVPVSS
jgi:hypothetical protein